MIYLNSKCSPNAARTKNALATTLITCKNCHYHVSRYITWFNAPSVFFTWIGPLSEVHLTLSPKTVILGLAELIACLDQYNNAIINCFPLPPPPHYLGKSRDLAGTYPGICVPPDPGPTPG